MAGKSTYEALKQRIRELETAEAERGRTEEALRESEERFRHAFENANTGVCLVSTEGRFIKVNDRLCEICGYSKQRLEGRPVNEITHPEDVGLSPEFFERSISGEMENTVYEKRFIHGKGRVVWAQISSSIVRDSEGKPLYFISHVQDITQRKLAQEALRGSEERFRAIFEQAAVGVGLVETKTGRFVRVNQKYCDITGYTQEEMTATSFMKITHPDDLQFNLYTIERVRKGEIRNYSIEKRYVRKDGQIVWVNATTSPMRDIGEQTDFHIVIVEDITDRRRAEEALQESKENLDKAQEIAHVGSWSRDLKTGQSHWSDEMYRILGFVSDRPERASFEIFLSRVHPNDRERVISVLEEAVEKKGSFDFEFRTVPIQGTERIIQNRGAVECDEMGAAVRAFGTDQDITEMRRLQAQLQQAKNLEALGVLAGGIAHDFNNILTMIMGNISLARMYAEEDSVLYRTLEEAEKASHRASDLTCQLLTFAKGSAPVKETASLAEVIKESAGFALRGAKTRADFIIPDKLWPAEIDVGQMNQVINNLIINADQAMPEGGVIRIEAENIRIGPGHGLPVKAGRYLKLSFKDNGVGIPQRHIQKIFDPYFSTKQRGSGLGLAMVYSIIHKHDGHITVDSELGVGTTFRIYLPASEKKAAETKEVETEPVAGHGKILVMDDEESIRNFTCRALNRLGYEVEMASDGQEAIEKYEKARESGRPFDAVILDLTIPGGMGGKEAIRGLKEIDSGVKAIVASGYSNDPVLSNHRDYGFGGIMAKPFNIENLGRTLHELLSDQE